MKRRIDNYSIGDGELTFIITEAGANHNRELDTAKIVKPGW
ncbi:MAG: hypothetical protein C5S49_06515 [Candidatus Methanogaster sp.]|nr:MAG: hypothetical protein C5S49_06515 [ANME-2 cluster archaeon]